MLAAVTTRAPDEACNRASKSIEVVETLRHRAEHERIVDLFVEVDEPVA
ncbi:MAG TPA: hypothetical protein VM784_01615 [Actinomycetota bacterium]|nr:hypothetical protein [Actinomycetota bacterium]